MPTPREAIEGQTIQGAVRSLTAPGHQRLALNNGDSAVTAAGKLALGGILRSAEGFATDALTHEALRGQQGANTIGPAVRSKAFDLSQPAIGLSGCLDAAKVLQNSGVTGGICAGAGLGFTGHGLLAGGKPAPQVGFGMRLNF